MNSGQLWNIWIIFTLLCYSDLILQFGKNWWWFLFCTNKYEILPANDLYKGITSNQEFINWPELIVTGIWFAVGQIIFTWDGLMFLIALAQVCPVSPRPWRKIMVAVCSPEGANTTFVFSKKFNVGAMVVVVVSGMAALRMPNNLFRNSLEIYIWNNKSK